MSNPVVTIGLPVFNASHFLGECLDSLVTQSYPNLRIVISDNASSDDTVAICQRYATRDPRVQIVRADRNRGAGWNHQRVLELAEGKYFKWCGADDVIGPGEESGGRAGIPSHCNHR
jgi:glycosyltransferase involved in cell wall biosynthesis